MNSIAENPLFRQQAFCGGEWVVASSSGAAFSVLDPADGSVLATLPDLTATDARAAIAAAALAQKAWAREPAKARGKVLRRWFDLVVENVEDLARILTAEQGKPLAEARTEILSNAAYLEWFAEEAKRLDGEIIPGPHASQRILILRQPVGVCAAITPWNFPNGMITRKVGPALAAGCTMVLKPSELTPLSALARLIRRIATPKAFAAEIAPLLQVDLTKLSDTDVARLATASADEIDRRGRKRLGS